MDSNLTDAEVVRRSIAEPTLFGIVYERHGLPVARYLSRRVGDGLSEDLAAEVFVRAFRGRGSYSVRYDTALPWLLGIASNLIAHHRRSERRRLQAMQRVARTDRGIDPDRAQFGLAPELAQALRGLPAADRDTLLLIVWGELSYEEAALALHIPIGTVRSRVARARKRLAGQVGRALGDRSPARPPEIRLKGDVHV